MKNKIIIFGGSFDPIHKGHIKIANVALKSIKANKLIFVPCSRNYPGDKIISAPDEHRIQMIKLMIEGNNKFEISKFEIDNMNKQSYTIETIKHFKQIYPSSDLYLLIGYDQLINLENWKKYDEILSFVKILCYPRRTKNKKKVNFTYIKIKATNINVSSTKAKINPSEKLLDKRIIDYINEYGLYAIERLKEVMSQYRLEHSISVAKIAKNLAKIHNLTVLENKAYVAGLYHDYAKEIDKNIQVKLAKKLKIENYPSWKVLHGPIGAYLIQKKFLINDYQILNSIKNHVIPEDFSTLTKILYIADKISPRHDSDKKILEEWKKMSEKNIDECFKNILDYNKRTFN